MKENSKIFPVEKMCRIFQIHKSSFFRWRKRTPTARSERKAHIITEIIKIYHWSQCRYGSPRIAKELDTIGIKVSRKFVGQVMKENHLRSIAKSKYKKTTSPSRINNAVENRLEQIFKAGRINEIWVSDMTYIETAEGWLYLTVVIDLFDRKVIGWSISETMRAKNTSIASLAKALLNRPLQHDQELLFHSDRGIQYTCSEFTALLSDTGQITQSMSRKGNCYDNAIAESFFKTLKVELVYQNKYKTKEKAEKSIADYIENFYNTCRRHSALGNLTIKEFQNQQSIK
ncbi:IS3 family transposase [Flavobacterium sp. KACC 22763]|uniref:IS3 family transposase n=1 Tax=Flavobacterium sp. KACC 22763 TaxID=3025668 RepID=UPI0023667A4A|nr:IS3 family transposase [Flavobacterium sp. KACC 22763]WDF66713.1 IS3 family transposase [Flavobacterium sp. KACC 22763]